MKPEQEDPAIWTGRYDPECLECQQGNEPHWLEDLGEWVHDTRVGMPHGFTCPRLAAGAQGKEGE